MVADTVAIGRFSAGLHTELDPAQLPDGASPDVMNVMTHRGDLRVRPGRQVTTDLPVAGPTALTEYVHDDGARLLAAAGGKVYATGANTTAFADTGMAVNAGNRPRLSQFKDTAYCVDGVGSVRTWNPTAGAKTLEQLIKPYHDFTKIEQTNTNTNLGDLTTGTDTGIGAGQYGAVYPMTGYYWNVKYFQDPATEFKAYPQQNKYFDEFFGTTCRLFHTITDYEEKAMDSVLGLEIIGRPTDQSFSAHSMMRQYIATGIYQDGMDLSQATILELTYKVIAAPGSDMPGITLHFGEDNDISHDATLIVCAPGDTTDQVNNWVVKKQVDLTQLLPAQLNSVKWIGIDIYNGGTDHGGTRETARLEMTDGTFLHTTSTGVTFLLSELSVNLYQSNFLPGQEYDLCYTYTYGDEESAASSVHLYPINSDAFIVPSNLLISIPRITTVSDTDQTPITPPDKASLYARGGLLGTEFVLIDTIDFATATANEDGSYSFKAWNGTVSDITVLSQYTERPPADCRLLFPHKGRMLYIGPNLDTKAYDTLFISNWDDAAHVPQALTVDTPPLFGGWIVIGEDGGEITGLGAWGSYCLIFKRLGIWQLSGETASDFAITPVSVSHGCVAHETVQQIEDGVTVWLDHNHVWAMTTQGIQNIGLPIERLLKAYSVEQQAQAFAVFDKGRGWYHLTLPDGVTFVLYRTDSGEWAWSRWTGQPAACGVYATQWCAPGTYAGDATRPTLCRLNTGCTDEGTPIPFSWTSATLQAPNAQADKAVTDIRIYGSDDLEEYGEAVLTSCTADYHRDSPGAQVTPRAINIDRHASMGRWCLPFSTPTKRYHVTLSGSSSTGGIVAAMAIDYHVRGVK